MLGRQRLSASWGMALSISSATPQAVTGLSAGVTALAMGEATPARSSTAQSNAGVRTSADSWATDQATAVRHRARAGLTSGVTATASGDTPTVAPSSTAGALCWGNNSYGQLGNGTQPKSTPQTVMRAGSRITA